MGVGLVKQARACGYKGSKQAVLIALAERANEKRSKDRNCCWPSMATLTNDAGYCVRTVQGQLNALEQEGRITRIYQTGKPTKYWIHPGGKPTPAKSAGVQKLRQTPAALAANPRKTCGETIRNQKRIGDATPIGALASRIVEEQMEQQAITDGTDLIDAETFSALVKSLRKQQ